MSGDTKTKQQARRAIMRGIHQARTLGQEGEKEAHSVMLALRASGLCVIRAGDDLNAFLGRRRRGR